MSKEKIQPTVLLILDGFGLADPEDKGNAITPKTAPTVFSYMKKYPTSQLKAHGRYAGLFKNQQGNSEAGHMNIGAGRIVKQDLVEISDAIEDGTFYKKEAFKQAIFHLNKYKSSAHIMGLLTDGNSAHSNPEHLHALLELMHREKIKKVYLHLFTDGRDSSPHGAAGFLSELRKKMRANVKIATIMGRFYAMDRNKQWERTQQCYEAMVMGKGCVAPSAEEALSQSYNRGDTDEYICPTVIVEKNKTVATVKDYDVLFFFNSRSDRARQISKAFVQPQFIKHNPGAFERTKFPKNTRFVAMTDFGPDLDHIMTAFPSPDLTETLPMALKHVRQLYISESEKYAHVTYFINGGYADPVNGEDRIKIDSPRVSSYDKKPAMSCSAVAAEVIKWIKKDKYDFYCINFANPDMIGHTGNIKAAKKALKIVDQQTKRIVELVNKKKGNCLIIADHGNAEEMINLKTDEMMTEHTTNPVPCIYIGQDKSIKKIKNGILADVAPTILKIMGIKKPKEMTGKTLL